MIYGYVNSSGILVFTTQNSPAQNIEGMTCVELDAVPGQPPFEYAEFDYNQQKWIDSRSNEEKYNIACSEAINKRNNLLYASDWTQIPNNPLSPEKQQEWEQYRQQLRDITQQSGYPFNIIWPTQPQ